MTTVRWVGVLLLVGRSLAGATGDEVKAQADALFDQAKALETQGDYPGACKKFEDSIRILDQIGTHLNLADCYDHVGRTASAWLEFRTAKGQAEKASDDRRAEFAGQRADALEPRLDKMTIDATAAPGLEVRRDGVVVAPALYGSAVAVDPGAHRIEARAPGREPFAKTVDVTGEGQLAQVEVALDAGAPIAAEPGRDGRGPRIAGVVVAGAGVAAWIATAALAIDAKSTWSAGEKDCTGVRCGDPGYAKNQTASSLANAATGVFIAGAVLVAAGAAIYLIAPRPERRAALVPLPGGVGVFADGRF